MASLNRNKVVKPIDLGEPSKDEFEIERNSRSRRRKGFSKPRRIEQTESVVALNRSQQVTSESNLNSVLENIVKVKQAEGNREKSKDNYETMIDIHESLLHHRHSPKTITSSSSPTRSVESPESLYMSEKMDDVASESGKSNSVDAFVKVHAQTNAAASREQALLASSEMQRQASLSPFRASPRDNRSQEVPDVIQRSNSDVSVSSPTSLAAPAFPSSAYDAMNGNHASAIVAMAAGMGLPTMIPTATVPTMLSIPGFNREVSMEKPDAEKCSLNGLAFNGGRGIIGSGGGLSRRASVSPTPEERAQYKRPPHTYPALIASAILDSPGNLITLRGIYEYIMNNFPYYKYCHDKSAWQNSIRHNLSLNQCFVKVPRYENAAKSNYWTMTREGFEEFGNENSFKRRRRRGAALAPISAYKAKKYSNESSKTGKNKSDNKVRLPNSNPSAPPTLGDDSVSLHPHLVGLAAARAWAPSFRCDDNQMNGRKRSLSPLEVENAKQRKLGLKAGDLFSLGQQTSDATRQERRPSSADNMPGALNPMTKGIFDPSVLSNGAVKRNSTQLLSKTLSWNSKNISAASSMLFSPLTTGDHESSDRTGGLTSDDIRSTPVTIEGVEIGNEISVRSDSLEVPVRHFRCRFCAYAYVSTSGVMLEQHARMLHHLEVASEKAKLVAAASKKQSENDEAKETARQLVSFQSLMSGLTSTSMMAAAQSNVTSLLAGSRASAGNTAGSFPYSGTFASGILNDSLMRSIAEQAAVSRSSATADREATGLDALAFQRQQALNSALQQAAASSSSLLPQEQLRLFYQQVAMNNPFLTSSVLLPRQVSTTEPDQPSQIKQHLWQYQQKLLSQMKVLSDSNAPALDSSFFNASNGNAMAEQRASPSKSPASYTEVDGASKRSIHGWKQCRECSFTAKGDHGLELHYRKAHADVIVTSNGDDATPSNGHMLQANGSPSMNQQFTANNEQSSQTKFEQRCESPDVDSFPTPPLSNSPTCNKRQFEALDLSGIKEEKPISVSAATQTASDASSGARTCEHCNIVFGDDMMHALHMSCHDREEPFKCKVCGLSCNERYFFNVHLLRGVHHRSESVGSAPDSSADGHNGGDSTSASRCPSNGSATASDVIPDVAMCQ